MAGSDLPNVELRQIEPGDKLTGLSLGDATFTPLKTFLQRHALKYEAQDLARTYALFRTDNEKVGGYITVVCGEVVVENGPPLLEADVEYEYSSYPAVKVARLAIDRRLRGGGYGRSLVEFVLGLTKDEICPRVGCRFVMVDSKKESVDFYSKCGFTMIDTDENRARDEPVMFIDLQKISPDHE